METEYKVLLLLTIVMIVEGIGQITHTSYTTYFGGATIQPNQSQGSGSPSSGSINNTEKNTTMQYGNKSISNSIVNITMLNSSITPSILNTQKGLNLTAEQGIVSNFKKIGSNVIYTNYTVPYGQITNTSSNNKYPAGARPFYAIVDNKTLDIVNTTIIKAQAAISIKANNDRFFQPNSTATDRLPSFQSNKCMNISLDMEGSALNPLTYIYNIKYVANGTKVLSGQINQLGYSKILNLCVPINAAVNVTLDALGNANYSTVDPSIVIVPSPVLHFVPINLTNKQNMVSNNLLQDLVVVNSLLYNPVSVRNVIEAPSLNNTVWFYPNGTVIPAWCEANCTNTAALTVWWLRLTAPVNSISNTIGNSVIVEYGMYANTVNFDGVNTGEYPNASKVYGKYDNGAQVFNLYDNFVGTGGCQASSLWHKQSGGYNTISICVSNGLTMYSVMNTPVAQEILTTSGALGFSASNITNQAVDVFANVILPPQNSPGFWKFGFVADSAASPATAGANVLVIKATGSGAMAPFASVINVITGSGYSTLFKIYNIPVVPKTGNVVFSLMANVVTDFYNGTSIGGENNMVRNTLSTNPYAPVSPNPSNMIANLMFMNNIGGTSNAPLTVFWTRIRTIPPNNIFLSPVANAFFYNAIQITSLTLTRNVAYSGALMNLTATWTATVPNYNALYTVNKPDGSLCTSVSANNIATSAPNSMVFLLPSSCGVGIFNAIVTVTDGETPQVQISKFIYFNVTTEKPIRIFPTAPTSIDVGQGYPINTSAMQYALNIFPGSFYLNRAQTGVINTILSNNIVTFRADAKNSKTDVNQIKALIANGVVPMEVLDYAVNTVTGAMCQTGASSCIYNQSMWNATIKLDIANYSGVHSWEILNEYLSNINTNGQSFWNGSIVNYAYMVRDASTIIKSTAGHQNDTLVCFGGSAVIGGNTHFARDNFNAAAELFQAANTLGIGSRYCDAISLHTYTNAGGLLSSARPGQVPATYAGNVMEWFGMYENLTLKPIWVTEFGIQNGQGGQISCSSCTMGNQLILMNQSLSLYSNLTYVKNVWWFTGAGTNSGKLSLTGGNGNEVDTDFRYALWNISNSTCSSPTCNPGGSNVGAQLTTGNAVPAWYGLMLGNNSRGAPPYTYSLTLSNTLNRASVILTNTMTSTWIGNTYTFYPTAGMIGDNLQANTFITESTLGTTQNTIQSGNILIFPAFIAGSLIVTNSILDAGQTTCFTASVSGGTPPYYYNYVISNAVNGHIINGNRFVITSTTSNSFCMVLPSANDANGILNANIVVLDNATIQQSETYNTTLSTNPPPTLTANSLYTTVGSNVLITATIPSGGILNLILNGQIINSGTGTLTNTIQTNLIGYNAYKLSANDIGTGTSLALNITTYQPLIVRNTTANFTLRTNFSTIPSPTIVFNSVTVLTNDVYAYDIKINSGAVITTNSFNFYSYNSFSCNGATILSGNDLNSGGYGGISKGGAGGYGLVVEGNAITFNAGTQCSMYFNGIAAVTGSGTGSGVNGGNTLVPAGLGYGSGNGNGNAGHVGTTFAFTWNNIHNDWLSGISNIVRGAGGGAIDGGSSGRNGASFYNSIGGSGGGAAGAVSTQVCGGGGGGGSLLIVVGSGGYTAGINNFNGGGIGTGGCSNPNAGGVGGAGTSDVFDYNTINTTEPIPVSIGVNAMPILYIPIRLYTQSKNSSVLFTLSNNINNGAFVNDQLNALNVNYIVPTTSPTGTYSFIANEVQLGNSIRVFANFSYNATSVTNMISLPYTAFQYLPDLAVIPSNGFTTPPINWTLYSTPQSYSHVNSGANEIFSGSGTSVSNMLHLCFNILCFNTTALNNPLLGTTMSLTPFTFVAGTSGQRQILNITSFDEQTFNRIASNSVFTFTSMINNYTFNSGGILSTGTTTFNVYIPLGFQNPPITITNVTSVTSNSGYSQVVNNFCPVTIPSGIVQQWGTYSVATGVGGTFTIQIYQGTSFGGQGDTLLVQTTSPLGVLTTVQTFRTPASPFGDVLVGGQAYRFILKLPNCGATIYNGSLSIPVISSPITINLASTSSNVPITGFANVNATCSTFTNSISGANIVNCIGADTNLVTKNWTINVYNITSILGTTALLATNTIAGSSFNWNYTLAIPKDYYRINIYATWISPGNVPITQLVRVYYPTTNSSNGGGGTKTAGGFILLIIFIVLGFVFFADGHPAFSVLMLALGIFLAASIFVLAIPSVVYYGIVAFAVLYTIWYETDTYR